jgi:hypothetical protein
MSPTDFEDPNLALNEAKASEVLDGEFVRPCEKFQGKLLWPYTPGTRNLYAMAQSDSDSVLYRILAFIFIHVRRGEKEMEADIAKNIVPLIWENLNLFRFRVLEFRSSLSDSDLDNAIAIARKELKLEGLSEVSASPPEIGPSAQKKSPPTIRPARAGKSSRQRKK